MGSALGITFLVEFLESSTSITNLILLIHQSTRYHSVYKKLLIKCTRRCSNCLLTEILGYKYQQAQIRINKNITCFISESPPQASRYLLTRALPAYNYRRRAILLIKNYSKLIYSLDLSLSLVLSISTL
jgi:hypothetical protein